MQIILPNIIAFLTRFPREQVSIVWSDNSWTHNVFRFWELIAWRREGIRREAYAYARNIEGKTVVFRQFFTLEARIAHYEGVVREFFKSMSRVRVRVTLPVLITPNGFRIPLSPYLFAIAVDATGSLRNSGGATPISFSFTCTGSNLGLFSDSISFLQNTATMTYNISSMTKFEGIDGQTNLLNAPEGFYLNAPSTGSNTLAGTYTDDDNCALAAVSYTGVSQTSGVIDSHATGSTNAATSLTTSSTVVASGCWHVLFGNTDQAMTASTGSNLRLNMAAFGDMMWDSNGTVSTGSQSMAVTISPSGKGRTVIFSIAPPAAAGPSNLKTYNTNVKSNIKTVDTNTLANMKTLDTNA